MKDALRASIVFHSHLFCRNDGNGHWDSCRRDRNGHQIDRKSHLIESNALPTHDSGKDNPIEGSYDLDNNTGNGKDQRPFEELVIALGLCHFFTHAATILLCHDKPKACIHYIAYGTSFYHI